MMLVRWFFVILMRYCATLMNVGANAKFHSLYMATLLLCKLPFVKWNPERCA